MREEGEEEDELANDGGFGPRWWPVRVVRLGMVASVEMGAEEGGSARYQRRVLKLKRRVHKIEGQQPE